jgi:hypothetical protein
MLRSSLNEMMQAEIVARALMEGASENGPQGRRDAAGTPRRPRRAERRAAFSAPIPEGGAVDAFL